MAITDLVSSLSENPYFGAGFGLFGVGAGAAILRKAFQVSLIAFRRHYMITLEPCYRYGRAWIRVERTREQHTLDLHAGTPWETVQLTAFGRDKGIYFNILEEARQMALSQHEGKTIMYTAMGSEWRPFGHPRKKRPISSVILDDGISERIVSDCKEFISTPTWYIERGIPYRRGKMSKLELQLVRHKLICYEGLPFIWTAGLWKIFIYYSFSWGVRFSICVLNLSERGLTDDRLNHLLSLAPQQSIVLLEDIDAAFVSREDTPQQKAAFEGLNRVTFSGLLNCLDGVASTEARMVFMTTNYLERLDPALIRPGRVDLKEYIGWCSQIQIEKMFLRFYNAVPDAKLFAEKVISFKRNVSPAQIQGYFMLHKHSSPWEVVENFKVIWKL
ncbi:hypothetical protein NQ317_014718 [Molorchus minor]|uniref:BCS1 N-terminal domain-containing protein n=1 Tax=Molorchus minor TaxID=1323400 RepID=A0ABQ9JYH6_9CUCU|nr:hypothetical protein NQ317_014718 [Molorchus minor]